MTEEQSQKLANMIARLEEALTQAEFAIDAESLQEFKKVQPPRLIPVQDSGTLELKHWIPVWQVAEVLMRLRDARGGGDA